MQENKYLNFINFITSRIDMYFVIIEEWIIRNNFFSSTNVIWGSESPFFQKIALCVFEILKSTFTRVFNSHTFSSIELHDFSAFDIYFLWSTHVIKGMNEWKKKNTKVIQIKCINYTKQDSIMCYKKPYKYTNIVVFAM